VSSNPLGKSCRINKYMKNIIIRAIGRLPDAWSKEAAESYLLRLKPYAKIQVIELPEASKGTAKPDPERVKVSEAESLLKGIPDNAFVVAMDEQGKTITSEAFAAKLDAWNQHGPVVFLIGGSWGLHASVRNRANHTLAFGPMTFTHAMARVMLLEQLYRAAAISSGKEYHK